MAFIKTTLHYRSLPKIRRYIRYSGDQAAALPFNAALLAADNDPLGGRLSESSSKVLEAKCGWDGVPGRGVASLIKAGIMEETEEGFRFIGWDEGWSKEQGHIVFFHRRAVKAGKARQSKPLDGARSSASSSASSYAPSNASSMNGGRHRRTMEVIAKDD